MTTPLHLVKLTFNAQRLYAFARSARLPARDFDDGYAVHAAMAALFDHGRQPEERRAPKPFTIAPNREGAIGRTFEVLGYSTCGAEELLERAQTYGDPAAWHVCDAERMASKPMPPAFAKGTVLGFSVRACCVRRVAKRGNQRKARAEVDAFLARSWELNDPSVTLEREAVYRDWLVAELCKADAVQVEETKVTSFRLARLHRRSQGEDRQGARVQHPDVSFHGKLTVTDPEAFARHLARGVGRHRSFGYGMLLLTPPRG